MNKENEIIKVCVDRNPLTVLNAHKRMLHSIRINPKNEPGNLIVEQKVVLDSFLENPRKVFSVPHASMLTEMAMATKNMWGKGTTITISFMNGSEIQRQKTKQYAELWLQYANIKFDWVDGADSMIRIAFQYDDGSWSTVGTDCLSVSTDEPTMNYGWLYDNTSNAEWQRVVVHEFGHALGCIHEQASPVADIDWDKNAVYAYYQGPPNNWTREQVDGNIFEKYAVKETQFTDFDPTSIMEYPIPARFLKSGQPIGMNLTLSETDKTFIKQKYPL